jgi:hypothetical protein
MNCRPRGSSLLRSIRRSPGWHTSAAIISSFYIDASRLRQSIGGPSKQNDRQTAARRSFSFVALVLRKRDVAVWCCRRCACCTQIQVNFSVLFRHSRFSGPPSVVPFRHRPSGVPSDFLKGKFRSARPAWTRTTARRYGRKAVCGRGGSRPAGSRWLPRVCQIKPSAAPTLQYAKSHTLRAVSDAWRGHVRDAAN